MFAEANKYLNIKEIDMKKTKKSVFQLIFKQSGQRLAKYTLYCYTIQEHTKGRIFTL